MEPIDLEKIQLHEDATQEERDMLLLLSFEFLKKMEKSLAALQEQVNEIKEKVDEPVNPYRPASISNVYEGELQLEATGEWVKFGKVWRDPQGYVRNQAEYDAAHPTGPFNDSETSITNDGNADEMAE